MTISRACLFFVMGTLLGAGLPACAGPRLNVKTWFLDVNQAEQIQTGGVLIRKHTSKPTEILNRDQSKGYRCVNAKDYDLLIYLAKQAGIRGIQ